MTMAAFSRPYGGAALAEAMGLSVINHPKGESPYVAICSHYCFSRCLNSGGAQNGWDLEEVEMSQLQDVQICNCLEMLCQS